MCYLHETATKMKIYYKYMILLTIKAHLTGKSCGILSQITKKEME